MTSENEDEYGSMTEFRLYVESFVVCSWVRKSRICMDNESE